MLTDGGQEVPREDIYVGCTTFGRVTNACYSPIVTGFVECYKNRSLLDGIERLQTKGAVVLLAVIT